MVSISRVFKFGLLVTISATLATARRPCVITKFEQVSHIVKNCKQIVLDSVLVPAGQQLVLDLSEGSTLTFKGNTSFNFYEWKGPLVLITGVNISVNAQEGSVLDGLGPLYWDGQGGWGKITKPKFIRIEATNAIFDGINVRNCPLGCVSIRVSENVVIRNWKIDNSDGDEDHNLAHIFNQIPQSTTVTVKLVGDSYHDSLVAISGVAPENKFGHNTDGFGIGKSQNILIEDCVIYNQDDCVVINSGKHLTVRNVFCHGSHGLSLSAGVAKIEYVLIENSIVTMAENGIHIKTHVDSGEGLIRNVLYRNITLLDSKFYGINIEQNYKNLPAGKPQDGPPKNNIPIHNLTLINIFGNALEGAIPVYVLCADEGCFDWKWEGVNVFGARSDNCTNYVPEGYNC